MLNKSLFFRFSSRKKWLKVHLLQKYDVKLFRCTSYELKTNKSWMCFIWELSFFRKLVYWFWYFSVFCELMWQVRNFISLGGPHAGTASVPLCGVSLKNSKKLHLNFSSIYIFKESFYPINLEMIATTTIREVKNFVLINESISVTHNASFYQTGIFCIIADKLIKSEIYSDYIQVRVHSFPFSFVRSMVVFRSKYA